MAAVTTAVAARMAAQVTTQLLLSVPDRGQGPGLGLGPLLMPVLGEMFGRVDVPLQHHSSGIEGVTRKAMHVHQVPPLPRLRMARAWARARD